MSQDRPAIDDILLTVQKFLENCAPKLDPAAKYQAQVASYLLGICEREIRLSPTFDHEEQARLSGFLKMDGSLDELKARLCSGIRAGRHDGVWDEVLDLILSQTVDKVRVVRPEYLASMHRITANER